MLVKSAPPIKISWLTVMSGIVGAVAFLGVAGAELKAMNYMATHPDRWMPSNQHMRHATRLEVR